MSRFLSEMFFGCSYNPVQLFKVWPGGVSHAALPNVCQSTVGVPTVTSVCVAGLHRQGDFVLHLAGIDDKMHRLSAYSQSPSLATQALAKA